MVGAGGAGARGGGGRGHTAPGMLALHTVTEELPNNPYACVALASSSAASGRGHKLFSVHEVSEHESSLTITKTKDRKLLVIVKNCKRAANDARDLLIWIP